MSLDCNTSTEHPPPSTTELQKLPHIHHCRAAPLPPPLARPYCPRPQPYNQSLHQGWCNGSSLHGAAKPAFTGSYNLTPEAASIHYIFPGGNCQSKKKVKHIHLFPCTGPHPRHSAPPFPLSSKHNPPGVTWDTGGSGMCTLCIKVNSLQLLLRGPAPTT